MAAPSIDFRFSNRAAWSTAFGLTRSGTAVLPWAGVPVYQDGGAYGPGSCCTDAGDLYLADPAVVTGPWTGAATRARDVDARGLPRWKLFGAAARYQAVPWDLTAFIGLVLAIKACDVNGDLIDPRVKLKLGTADGSLLVTNGPLGGVQFAARAARTKAIAAGLYRYDLVALDPEAEPHRLKYGLLLVDDGIAP